MYCVNLAVSFQIGFVLEHDYKKRLLLDGLHVARFYILRGSFFIDGMAVLPVVYQVIKDDMLPPAYGHHQASLSGNAG